jgi:hypothetical protein
MLCSGDGIPEPIQLSLDDLKTKVAYPPVQTKPKTSNKNEQFHPVDLTATIMCGGNRR